ncbi:MAG: PilZ domain-containing protein [Desulfarculaceae bacterium]|nr:PilZ domain-containing protein [Desulfarculaceae bacterium]
MKLWPFHMERRSEPRHPSSLKACFLVRDQFSGNQLTEQYPAIIMDHSPSGCCLALERLDCGGFHLHRCLEAPQDYPLELCLRPEEGAELTVQGEVRWINREMTAEGPPFRVGLRLCMEDRATPLAWRRLNRKN